MYAFTVKRESRYTKYYRSVFGIIEKWSLGPVQYLYNIGEWLLLIFLLCVSVGWLDSGSGWLSVMSLLSVVLVWGKVARWKTCVLLRQADSRISLRVEHRTVLCSSSVRIHSTYVKPCIWFLCYFKNSSQSVFLLADVLDLSLYKLSQYSSLPLTLTGISQIYWELNNTLNEMHSYPLYILYTHTHTVPSISIGAVKTKLLCWLWSQDIWKYDEKLNRRQNYRMSHFIISRLNTHVLPKMKRTALLEFIPLIDVSISIGTVEQKADMKD